MSEPHAVSEPLGGEAWRAYLSDPATPPGVLRRCAYHSPEAMLLVLSNPNAPPSFLLDMAREREVWCNPAWEMHVLENPGALRLALEASIHPEMSQHGPPHADIPLWHGALLNWWPSVPPGRQEHILEFWCNQDLWPGKARLWEYKLELLALGYLYDHPTGLGAKLCRVALAGTEWQESMREARTSHDARIRLLCEMLEEGKVPLGCVAYNLRNAPATLSQEIGQRAIRL